MTKEKAIEALREIQTDENRERAHIAADKVLCDLLKSLGCEDVVEEYDSIYKWYA